MELEGEEWSISRSSYLSVESDTLVLILYEVGWTPQPIDTFQKTKYVLFLPQIGYLILGRPVCSVLIALLSWQQQGPHGSKYRSISSEVHEETLAAPSYLSLITMC